MKSFAIDLYLWADEVEEWLFVPAAGSPLHWPAPPGLAQAQMLSTLGGLTFRVDHVLWLGNERDGLPLDVIVFGLAETLHKGNTGDLLAKMPVGEHISIEVRQGSDDQVLVSRLSTRCATDFLEQTAIEVGTYYQDFAIDSTLWRSAVERALDGLAIAFAASPESKLDVQRSDLADWLSQRGKKLS